jgi:uncharacterized membrane protein YgdD (TMEM256/DUF423 family)
VDQQLKLKLMNRGVVLKGLVFIIIAIMMGAFGAHYLETILRPKQLNALKTGIDYQLYAGIIMLVLGLNYNAFKFSIKLPINFFFIGACCFSLSLYILSLFNKSYIVHYIWPITPIGGLLMILGLIILSYKLIKKN